MKKFRLNYHTVYKNSTIYISFFDFITPSFYTALIYNPKTESIRHIKIINKFQRYI